jgi:hypothetical protein
VDKWLLFCEKIAFIFMSAINQLRDALRYAETQEQTEKWTRVTSLLKQLLRQQIDVRSSLLDLHELVQLYANKETQPHVAGAWSRLSGHLSVHTARRWEWQLDHAWRECCVSEPEMMYPTKAYVVWNQETESESELSAQEVWLATKSQIWGVWQRQQELESQLKDIDQLWPKIPSLPAHLSG